MIGLGIAMVAVGAADLVAGGLAGQPPRRLAHGAATALVLSLGGAVLAGASPIGLLAVPAVTVAGTVAWQLARRQERVHPRRAWVALGVLALLGPAALTAGLVGGFRGGPLLELLTALDIAVLRGQPLGRVLVVIGAALAMTGTANAVVRIALTIAGPGVARSGSALRGGRLIGPLERLLIFGLTAASQPEAATIVVAAKALLRFPELSALARSRAERREPGAPATALDPLGHVDAVTEYFLIGSLTSWALAFLAALLVAT